MTAENASAGTVEKDGTPYWGAGGEEMGVHKLHIVRHGIPVCALLRLNVSAP